MIMNDIPDNFLTLKNSLENRIILVTGATGGYGKAISLAASAASATVILLGRKMRLVEALYDEIESAGSPKPAIYPMNLGGATEQDYYDLAANIEKEFGRLDGLIHCAAQLGAPTPFEHSDSETWFQVHQVNLHAPYFMTRALMPVLKKSTSASVLFMVDQKVGAYWDAYGVSKQAVDALAQNIAAEVEGSAVHVNRVNPGKTRTALQLRAFPAADDNDQLPVPSDFNNQFIYLLSDQNSSNGQLFQLQA
ncbi:MAG: NAD(P)-dependent dehydrogenase (short-subunit alcohol dehydrogenase family) [Gammaproteobacteria bacterium]|jgi:NAD(P)-dependent dehydrogenase (short-subunit alcohol dehydrogenase family)